MSAAGEVQNIEGLVDFKDEEWIGQGGFGDVYRAHWKDSLQDIIHDHKEIITKHNEIVIKVIRSASRVQLGDVQKQYKKYWREISIWQSLDHENIVPFIGVAIIRGVLPAIVSAYMCNGTVISYLDKKPDTPRLPLVAGIAQGLSYLHHFEPAVVHGDLKAANILIDGEGNPRLGDFGLSRLAGDDLSGGSSTATSSEGTLRWMSPELLKGETKGTKESDMYAFGMTCLEIFTGKIPFHYLVQTYQVYMAVLGNEKPKRPSWRVGERSIDVPEEMWAFMSFCWDSETSTRPDAVKAVELTKATSWKRCPKCERPVELLSALPKYITCHCGTRFCELCLKTSGACPPWCDECRGSAFTKEIGQDWLVQLLRGTGDDWQPTLEQLRSLQKADRVRLMKAMDEFGVEKRLQILALLRQLGNVEQGWVLEHLEQSRTERERAKSLESLERFVEVQSSKAMRELPRLVAEVGAQWKYPQNLNLLLKLDEGEKQQLLTLLKLNLPEDTDRFQHALLKQMDVLGRIERKELFQQIEKFPIERIGRTLTLFDISGYSEQKQMLTVLKKGSSTSLSILRHLDRNGVCLKYMGLLERLGTDEWESFSCIPSLIPSRKDELVDLLESLSTDRRRQFLRQLDDHGIGILTLMDHTSQKERLLDLIDSGRSLDQTRSLFFHFEKAYGGAGAVFSLEEYSSDERDQLLYILGLYERQYYHRSNTGSLLVRLETIGRPRIGRLAKHLKQLAQPTRSQSQEDLLTLLHNYSACGIRYLVDLLDRETDMNQMLKLLRLLCGTPKEEYKLGEDLRALQFIETLDVEDRGRFPRIHTRCYSGSEEMFKQLGGLEPELLKRLLKQIESYGSDLVRLLGGYDVGMKRQLVDVLEQGKGINTLRLLQLLEQWQPSETWWVRDGWRRLRLATGLDEEGRTSLLKVCKSFTTNFKSSQRSEMGEFLGKFEGLGKEEQKELLQDMVRDKNLT